MNDRSTQSRASQGVALYLVLACGLALRFMHLYLPLGFSSVQNEATYCLIASRYHTYGPFDAMALASNPENITDLFWYLFPSSLVFVSTELLGPDIVAIRLPFLIISLLGVLVFYKLVEKTSGRTRALLSTTIFSILPINIYESTTIDTEFPSLFFLLLSYYFLAGNEDPSDRKIIYAGIIGGLSIFVKWKMIAVLAWYPVLLWLRRKMSLRDLGVYFGLSFLPTVLWGVYIQVRFGVSPLLLVTTNQNRFDPLPLLKLSFYKAITFRVLKGFTPLLALLWIVSLFRHFRGSDKLLVAWNLGFLTILFGLAKGLLIHEYYLVPLIPAFSATVALLLDSVLNSSTVSTIGPLGLRRKRTGEAFVLSVLVASLFLSGLLVTQYYYVEKRAAFGEEIGQLMRRSVSEGGSFYAVSSGYNPKYVYSYYSSRQCIRWDSWDPQNLRDFIRRQPPTYFVVTWTIENASGIIGYYAWVDKNSFAIFEKKISPLIEVLKEEGTIVAEFREEKRNLMVIRTWRALIFRCNGQ